MAIPSRLTALSSEIPRHLGIFSPNCRVSDSGAAPRPPTGIPRTTLPRGPRFPGMGWKLRSPYPPYRLFSSIFARFDRLSTPATNTEWVVDPGRLLSIFHVRAPHRPKHPICALKPVYLRERASRTPRVIPSASTRARLPYSPGGDARLLVARGIWRPNIATCGSLLSRHMRRGVVTSPEMFPRRAGRVERPGSGWC